MGPSYLDPTVISFKQLANLWEKFGEGNGKLISPNKLPYLLRSQRDKLQYNVLKEVSYTTVKVIFQNII